MGKGSSSGGLTTALSGHFLRDAWEAPTGTAEHGDGLIQGHCGDPRPRAMIWSHKSVLTPCAGGGPGGISTEPGKEIST